MAHERGRVMYGCAFGCVGNLLLLAIAFSISLSSRTGPVWTFLGIAQLATMIPAYIVMRRAGDTETAKGLLIAAGISFLLTASCWMSVR